MAGHIGEANVQHPMVAQGGMGGMSLALAPPPQHLCCWLTAPLHVPMLPSVAQSSAPLLPGTEQGDRGRAQLHKLQFCGSPNGQIPAGTWLFQP